MRTAVIFHRLGPYHFARLRAAGRLLPVTAIETSGADETYAWDLIAGADGFERVTLFGNADAQKSPAREVASRVGSALDKILPAVVAVPGWSDAAALSALRWCVVHGVPAIVMSESTVWDAERSTWREAVKRRIVGLCSAALVGGRPHKEYVVKLGMPAERIFLGYDAVDNGYFRENAEKLKAGNTSSRLRPPSPRSGEGRLPEKFFLASARFIEKKNLSRLIEAYALYRKKAKTQKSAIQKTESTSPRPSPQSGEGESALGTRHSAIWNLVLLGDGLLRSSIESQVSSLGLHGDVQMPGFIQYPDLPAYYAQAGAFVHASTTEQWGLVVNEAMASGLPVLVSNRCGCAQDLVQPGVNGFTFDPCNVEEIAQLMFQISVFQPSKLSALGDASREIISNWGTERFAFGLKQAVECALHIGPAKLTFLQKMLLKTLLAR
jgi:glycosyltransferase involved in cell wall biosynthesis